MTNLVDLEVVGAEEDSDADVVVDVEVTMTGAMAAVTEAMADMEVATTTTRATVDTEAATTTARAMEVATTTAKATVAMTTLVTASKAMETAMVVVMIVAGDMTTTLTEVANKAVMARARQAGVGGQGVVITPTAVNHE